MAIAISIGVFGVVACCLVFWTALVISKVDCADERSQALGFAKSAINTLLKIEWEDPKRMEALTKVSEWVEKRRKQEVPF